MPNIPDDDQSLPHVIDDTGLVFDSPAYVKAPIDAMTLGLADPVDESDQALADWMPDAASPNAQALLTVAKQDVRNSIGSIDQLVNIASTYHAHRAEFIYAAGNNTAVDDDYQIIDGKFPLDCSSLVHLLLRGVSFENSRYGGHTTNISGTPLFFPMDTSPTTGQRYTAQMAEWTVANGYGIIPEPGLTNAQPGDVLYFAWGNVPNSFMGVEHVCFYLDRANETWTDLLNFNDDFETLFYKASRAFIDQCVLIGRYPFHNAEPLYPYTNLVRNGNLPVTVTNTSLAKTLKLAKPLVKDRYYTLCVKGTVGPSPCYFSIIQDGQRLAWDYGRTSPSNEWNVLTFRFPAIADSQSDILLAITGPSSVPPNTRFGHVDWVTMAEGFTTAAQVHIDECNPYGQFLSPLDPAVTADIDTTNTPSTIMSLNNNIMYMSLHIPFLTPHVGNMTLGLLEWSDRPSETQRIPAMFRRDGGASPGYIQISTSGTITAVPIGLSTAWTEITANGIMVMQS